MSNIKKNKNYSSLSSVFLLAFGLSGDTAEFDLPFQHALKDPFVSLNGECKEAFVRGGVIMRDGKPAGHDLLTKPVLKVALIEANEDGAYNPSPTLLEILEFSDFYSKGLTPAKFPSDIQNLTKSALGFWGVSNIEFVSDEGDADLRILSHDSNDSNDSQDSDKIFTLGYANYPKTYNESVIDFPFIFINTAKLDNSHDFTVVLAHEFGHNIGIVHHEETIIHLMLEHLKSLSERNRTEMQSLIKGQDPKENSRYQYFEEKAADLYECAVNIVMGAQLTLNKILFNNDRDWSLGLMASDVGYVHGLTIYDLAAREFIRTNGESFGTYLDTTIEQDEAYTPFPTPLKPSTPPAFSP